MKQIKIEQLLPLLKSGWVAMDKGGYWHVFGAKPVLFKEYGIWGRGKESFIYPLPKYAFNIAPFDGSWKDSLIKVEHKEEE